jgi:hypothetical protein
MVLKKISASVIFTLFMVAGYAQKTISSYKYVLLPQKFDFLSSANEYELNSTAKSLLEQKGFTVYYLNESLPQALATNKCLTLQAEVTQRKALFSTNLTLLLKDCYGNVIFKGKEGRSWEKDFGVAYDQAMKNAFTTLNTTPYNYDSTLLGQKQQAATTTTAATAPGAAPAPAAAATAAPVTTTPITPAPAATTTTPVAAPAPNATLYAQPIPNGYQLIDTTPKKVMTLLKTSLPDCYLVDTGAGTTSGVVFKKGTEWFLEYYKDGNLVSQKLTIKF